MNVKSERQVCRLESQAGADPAVLRQSVFLLQEASGFTLQAFDWLDRATTVLRVISSTSVLRMTWTHIHKTPSQQHLDKCLFEPLETGLAKLTQKLDHHSFYQTFFFEKFWLLHCCYYALQSILVCIEWICEENKWGLLVLFIYNREILGRKRMSCKDIKM